MTPTQRSLKYLRENCYYAEVVEHWNQWAKRRQDLLGFADIIALRPPDPPLLVQVTSTGVSSRLKKIRSEPRAHHWVECGGRIEVHGWRKLKGHSAPQIRIVEVGIDEWLP